LSPGVATVVARGGAVLIGLLGLAFLAVVQLDTTWGHRSLNGEELAQLLLGAGLLVVAWQSWNSVKVAGIALGIASGLFVMLAAFGKQLDRWLTPPPPPGTTVIELQIEPRHGQ
jgi:uncharacterized membrane protein YbhN (UPF0104 family)